MSSYNRKRSPARKPQNRRASPAKKGMPAWLWFASGLAVGIFLMMIKGVGGDKSAPVAESPQETAPVVDSRPRPRFDFYDLLPESRVPVGADRPEPPPAPPVVAEEPRTQPSVARPEPAVVTAPPVTPPPTPRPEASPPTAPAAQSGNTATASTPAPAASNRFLLQAGSFRSQGDADNLRAQLLLMGLSASIETFTPNQGETWHRVIVGPYDNHQSMDSARSQLTANGIDTLMLRR